MRRWDSWIRARIVDKRWGSLSTRWDMRLKIGGLGWKRVPIFPLHSKRGGIGLYTVWCGIGTFLWKRRPMKKQSPGLRRTANVLLSAVLALGLFPVSAFAFAIQRAALLGWGA